MTDSGGLHTSFQRNFGASSSIGGKNEADFKSALLSQLYVTWVTSREGDAKISELIQETLKDLRSSSSSNPEGKEQGKSSTQQLTSHSFSSQKTRSPARLETAPPSHWCDPVAHDTDKKTSAVSIHSDPASSSLPPNSLSSDEIAPFYSRNLSQGILPIPNEDEAYLLEKMLSAPEAKEDMLSEFTTHVFKIPLWMKELLFDRIVERTKGDSESNELTSVQIKDFYTSTCANISKARRLFELIKKDPERDYITLDDLKTMTLYLVRAHSSLESVKKRGFRDYYARTVAIRIMYTLEYQQARKIYWQDFNRSTLPDVLYELDTKIINDEKEYFAYEDFYVLYCKFWELDTDRDYLINFYDMCNYGEKMLPSLVLQRVVDGYGRALSSGTKSFLDYEDFIYFCISEEEKNSQAAVYYWFKVLDLDADGILSGYELNAFVAENQHHLACCFDPDEPPSYDDMMCQMLDMLGVDADRLKSNNGGLTLADFRACPTPANFFNMVFNAPKFLMFDRKDPFTEKRRAMVSSEKTDWERFARREYDRMDGS